MPLIAHEICSISASSTYFGSSSLVSSFGTGLEVDFMALLASFGGARHPPDGPWSEDAHLWDLDRSHTQLP